MSAIFCSTICVPAISRIRSISSDPGMNAASSRSILSAAGGRSLPGALPLSPFCQFHCLRGLVKSPLKSVGSKSPIGLVVTPCTGSGFGVGACPGTRTI